MEVETLTGSSDASGLRVGVAVSTFNKPVTDGLLNGALGALDKAGAESVVVAEVPGAIELPLLARQFAAAGYDVVVALGAVIEGETDHYEHVAHRASEGLMRVALDFGIPVAFGVLTTRTADHAIARSSPGPANKGAEAVSAALHAATVLRKVATTGAGADAAGVEDAPLR